MDHKGNYVAEAYEDYANRNLAKLDDAGTIPYEAAATVAQALATLALSQRVAALHELLNARLPVRAS
jgi:hypothetical protein